MNGLTDFIQSMTIWNWLALIAFVFFPLSALNAFFGLRARYLDWQGTNSKKKFDARMTVLETLLTQIERYVESTGLYFRGLAGMAIRPTVLICGALMFFIGSYTISRLPFRRFLPFELVYAGLSLACMTYALALIIRIFRLIENVNHPTEFVKKVVDFVNEARKKQVIPIEADSLIKPFLQTKAIKDSREQMNIEVYWTNSHKEVAEKVFKLPKPKYFRS